MEPERNWTRRAVLAGGVAMAVSACSSSGSSGGANRTAEPTGAPTTTTSPSGRSTTTAAGTAREAFVADDFEGQATCKLTPEQTAGPFPLDEQFDRRDITEGSPGTPLRLGFRVLDESCAPVPGAAVEIWHADASGDYSAFTDNGGGKDEAEGTTFLRGTQTADDDGIVEFATIFPGWYRGRAVHIHVRVHLDDDIVLTSQTYFEPSVVKIAYRDEPYAEFGLPDTDWESDAIAGDPEADGTVFFMAHDRQGITGLINLEVPT